MSTLKVNTILSADTPTVNFTDGINVSGIVTATSFGDINVGTAVTISGNGNVAISGIVTATHFQTRSTYDIDYLLVAGGGQGGDQHGGGGGAGGLFNSC